MFITLNYICDAILGLWLHTINFISDEKNLFSNDCHSIRYASWVQ